ncbi:MAG: dTDP-4-dehydrorhamnose 3,5-epimerase family protein [Candidatus Omnitrophica bacterium]|nr:dTDP-4-dehydrorhamnose 3,5-epimerase family protein [Candidatus Omnitrophota bacterium]MDE2223593.1 dTDP-4-dehydrorhamnose 3,5-epimerase family protein [Candidatus Omnitrophota bacterium]
MIEGVEITPLKQIDDERGKVMHMLRRDSPFFKGFGEIYFSCINPGAVKGWNRHRQMVLNLAVLHGCVKFVLYDGRDKSETYGKVMEILMGPACNYSLLTVPPMIWCGFKGKAAEPSIIANCSSMPHEPSEIERRNPFDASIPYQWGKD